MVTGVEMGRVDRSDYLTPLVADVRSSVNNEEIRDVPVGEKEFSLEGSSSRAELLQKALAAMPFPCALQSAAKCLECGSVLNKFTCQQMVFCPGAWKLLAWRNVGD